MPLNRVFFPQALLDSWIADERVELTGDELRLPTEARSFKIVEAVRIVRDVSGGADSAKLIGKVKTRAQLGREAEILEGSLILGEDAYDVEPGFIGEPIPPSVPEASDSKGRTTERMLAEFLSQIP
ncbi:MAG: hypothetical protein NVSMB1_13840 [Polyangiales bacterium]